MHKLLQLIAIKFKVELWLKAVYADMLPYVVSVFKISCNNYEDVPLPK